MTDLDGSLLEKEEAETLLEMRDMYFYFLEVAPEGILLRQFLRGQFSLQLVARRIYLTAGTSRLFSFWPSYYFYVLDILADR